MRSSRKRKREGFGWKEEVRGGIRRWEGGGSEGGRREREREEEDEGERERVEREYEIGEIERESE